MRRLAQTDLLEGLANIVGEDHLSATQPDRIAYSADQWPRHQIWKQAGDVERYPPDAICWPGDEQEVSAVLAFLNAHHVPVIPYGGGSGVCGGTVPLYGGVVVDVKRLRAITAVDDVSCVVEAQAGINGQHLEDGLNRRGFTLGHFPSSIMCSTLGGWLAARSGGQFSSRYGKIEDMVLGCRVVFPDGSVRDTANRSPGGPDWTQLVVGSEGALGIVTSARLRVHPVPEARRLRGFRFKSLDEALFAMRLVMQAGLKPAVLRLYDPFDTLIALGRDGRSRGGRGRLLAPLRRLMGGDGEEATSRPARRGRLAGVWRQTRNAALIAALSRPAVLNRIAHATPSSCLLIIGFEGLEEVVRRDMWRARQLLSEEGGVDAGARPGLRWLEKRYAVSFKGTSFFQSGAFVDTMEVATTWDRLQTLYDRVHAAVSPHAFIMAHFSHAYREGCSIYFTFAGARPDAERAAVHHEAVWDAAVGATQAVGATASHHHGVGIVKRDAMPEEHGEMLRVWYAIKQVCDPHGIMNPGKLFPTEGANP